MHAFVLARASPTRQGLMLLASGSYC
jgi:hypothetical protein